MRSAACITFDFDAVSLKLTWSALAEDSRLLSANADEHRRVLAAVQQGNPAEARQAMKDHILRAGELVAVWFERPLASL